METKVGPPLDYESAMTCLGAIKSPEDSRDWIFEGLARGSGYNNELPPKFDLRKHMRPSRDQGVRGTCAAFTACAITEIHKNMGEGIDEWMSPEFIYFHRDNKPASGMYGRNVFQIMKKIGSVPEKHFPYQTSDIRVRNPSGALYICAQNYRIMSYARVKTVDGLRRALYELGPAYLLLPLYKTRPCFWRDDGTTCSGGHSTTVVGYNEQGFILKNSWGPRWNGDGTVIFPYDEWDTLWECWISINDNDKVVTKRRGSSASHIEINEKIEGLKEINLIDLENYKLAGNSESDSPPPTLDSTSAENLNDLEDMNNNDNSNNLVGGIVEGNRSSNRNTIDKLVEKSKSVDEFLDSPGQYSKQHLKNRKPSTISAKPSMEEPVRVQKQRSQPQLQLPQLQQQQLHQQPQQRPSRFSLRLSANKKNNQEGVDDADNADNAKCCVM